MTRLPRVVIVDVPHHVTQRGNGRLAQTCRRYHKSVALDFVIAKSGHPCC